MKHMNIEIKARTDNPDTIREILSKNNAHFFGVDNQIDTYFNVLSGRLKLREGVIENSLVYYVRENKKIPKQSNVTLYPTPYGSSLKEILTNSLGVLAVIDKRREIYFINNVKFHIDNVKDLGDFFEIEAIDRGKIGRKKLLNQCYHYLNLFKISKKDLIKESYCDLILRE